jgi:hypothetical protein
MLTRDLIAAYGGLDSLTSRVEAFSAALDAHRYTEGEAAPVEDPLVEQIARAGGMGAVEIEPEPEATEPVPPTLEQVKAAAVERINREAGDERAKHITVTTGQSATYIEKQKEAERYAAGGEGPFWYLEAEAEATGDTVEAVAALVLATAAAWTPINAAIEGKRRGALVAVDKAATAEEVEAIFPVAWPG